MNTAEEKKKLGQAIDSLNIEGIYISSSNTKREVGFSFATYEKPLQIQTFDGINQCLMNKIESENKTSFSYNYIMSAGIRIHEKKEEDKEDSAKDDNKEDKDIAKTLVEIQATFEAVYISDIELEKDCVEVFGNRNVKFNVWPYWREYVQSTCVRMGIDAIKVPFLNALKKEMK